MISLLFLYFWCRQKKREDDIIAINTDSHRRKAKKHYIENTSSLDQDI